MTTEDGGFEIEHLHSLPQERVIKMFIFCQSDIELLEQNVSTLEERCKGNQTEIV